MKQNYYKLVISIAALLIYTSCASQSCKGFLQVIWHSDTLIVDFQNTPFTIEHIPVPDSVYDDSIVRFTTHSTSGKTTLHYDTYVAANLLTITLNNIHFSIGSFDGAADTSIPNLIQTYSFDGQSEYNSIFVTAPILLTTENYRFSQSRPPSESPIKNEGITILPGSTLVWGIKKN